MVFMREPHLAPFSGPMFVLPAHQQIASRARFVSKIRIALGVENPRCGLQFPYPGTIALPVVGKVVYLLRISNEMGQFVYDHEGAHVIGDKAVKPRAQIDGIPITGSSVSMAHASGFEVSAPGGIGNQLLVQRVPTARRAA